MNLKRILMPTDFSPLANHAMACGCDLARISGAELIVLHVAPAPTEVSVAPEPGMLGAAPFVPLPAQGELASTEEALRASVFKACGGMPDKSTAMVRVGVPWREIVQCADEWAVDLIVIGSHARGIMKRILIGSTSKAVLEHASRPVLMVPMADAERAGSTTCDTALAAPHS